jgi:DNA-binding MarR family transcriptional regulator
MVQSIGTIIIDQKPADLSPDAIAVTGTKIIHALDREEDKKAVADAIGLTDEQKKHLSYLKRGEVFVKLDREAFPYRFHAQIKPVTFTGQVKRDEIKEYMKHFFETYTLNKTEVKSEVKRETQGTIKLGLEPSPAITEKKPPVIYPARVLENLYWLKSLKKKIDDLTEVNYRILILLGKGLGCKSSDLKARLRLSGTEFKNQIISLARKGLVGFKKSKAPGNPIFYFLRPEGLAAFRILTGKWPYESRTEDMKGKYRHSEMKEKIIQVFRRVGWRLTDNKVDDGYVDICLERDGLIIPVEICTGSNKYEQVYKNILKCVKAFGGAYFICENSIAYNLVLQQASKVSFDYDVKFLLYMIPFENFLKGKNFEKYEF